MKHEVLRWMWKKRRWNLIKILLPRNSDFNVSVCQKEMRKHRWWRAKEQEKLRVLQRLRDKSITASLIILKLKARNMTENVTVSAFNLWESTLKLKPTTTTVNAMTQKHHFNRVLSPNTSSGRRAMSECEIVKNRRNKWTAINKIRFMNDELVSPGFKSRLIIQSQHTRKISPCVFLRHALYPFFAVACYRLSSWFYFACSNDMQSKWWWWWVACTTRAYGFHQCVLCGLRGKWWRMRWTRRNK